MTTDTTAMPTLNLDRLRAVVHFAEMEVVHDQLTEEALANADPEELAKIALDYEENFAGQWNQSYYFEGIAGKRIRRDTQGKEYRVVPVDCGTSFCLAGHACVAAGDTFVVGNPAWNEADETVSVTSVFPKNGRKPVDIWVRAKQLLGLTEDEALTLFGGDNTIEDIRTIAGDICEARGLTF